MCKKIDVAGACALLREWDDVLILTHQRPDGDALGSAFALMWALEALGKRAGIDCADPIPERYRLIMGEYRPKQFSPRFVVSVDTAGPNLLGHLKASWENRIDLCIDHHRINTISAAYCFVDPEAPATAQLIYEVVAQLGVSFCPSIAGAIYTGLVTDTGCFRYPNVTARTHRIAAEMIEAGAPHGEINRIMFDTRSRAMVELDKILLETLEYHFGGLCALMLVSRKVTERLKIEESDLDGISAVPRRIQGVEVGLILRETPDGYRVSVRTREHVDASALCAVFDGGGHRSAGGCTIVGGEQEVRGALLPAVEQALRDVGLSWR